MPAFSAMQPQDRVQTQASALCAPCPISPLPSLQTRWLCFSVMQPALIYSPMLICNFTAYGPHTRRDELSTLVCSLDSEEGWKWQGLARAQRAAVAVVTSLLSGTHSSSV